MLKPWQPVTLTTVSTVALTLLANSHPASAITLRGSVEGAAPDSTEPTPVPAPALLPGLIILGFRAICKRGVQAKAVSTHAKT